MAGKLTVNIRHFGRRWFASVAVKTCDVIIRLTPTGPKCGSPINDCL